MKLIDNLNHRFGDDIKENLQAGSKLQIAASFFSIYAYAALKQELKNIDGMQFLFTSPTFVPNDVTDKFKKKSVSLSFLSSIERIAYMALSLRSI